MSMRRAFLDSIIEAPDDDVPRLVFADWLEDNGDPPRGQFIHAQIRGDQKRADGLLAEHEAAWRAELPGLGGIGWGCFVRGFVERVIASSSRRFLEHGERILAAAPVTRLRVRVPDWSSGFRSLCDSPRLLRLTELDLGNGIEVTPEALRRLAAAPNAANLRSLLVHQNPVGDGSLSGLARSRHLANLRELYASGIGATDNGIGKLSSGRLRDLEILDLRDNRITRDGAAALAAWDDGPATLWLVNNPLGDSGARAFASAALPGCACSTSRIAASATPGPQRWPNRLALPSWKRSRFAGIRCRKNHGRSCAKDSGKRLRD